MYKKMATADIDELMLAHKSEADSSETAETTTSALRPSLVQHLAPQTPGSSPLRIAAFQRMQQVYGNRAVQRLIAAPSIQRDDDDEDDNSSSSDNSSQSSDQDQSSDNTDPSNDTNPPEGDPGDSGSVEPLVVDMVEGQDAGAVDEGLTVANDPDQGSGTQDDSDSQVAAPSATFTNAGRVGTARYGDKDAPGSACFPHAFTDGGRSATVAWAGGGGAGARGNQGVGSLQTQTVPIIEGKQAGGVMGIGSHGEAWVRAGTGIIDVVRSWVGIDAGNQGNGQFVTPAAATRINGHEMTHVARSQAHYNTNIQPLLDRIKAHTGEATSPTAVGATPVAAQQGLIGVIDWANSINAFVTADTADNAAPNGAVDTADVASGTWPVDAGPGTVGGTAFQHRVRLPAEANPA